MFFNTTDTGWFRRKSAGYNLLSLLFIFFRPTGKYRPRIFFRLFCAGIGVKNKHCFNLSKCVGFEILDKEKEVKLCRK
jgi:hypothetical protein